MMFHGFCGSGIWDVLGNSGVDASQRSWSSWELASSVSVHVLYFPRWFSTWANLGFLRAWQPQGCQATYMGPQALASV